MIDYDKVFEALPNVQTIWVTKDGHFHLHPHNGGEQIDRDKLEPIKPIEPKLENEPVKLEPVKQPDDEQKHRSKGRPKKAQ